MRPLTIVLAVVLAILVASPAIASPNEARIPLDSVRGVAVLNFDQSWTVYVNGAPERVNREFTQRYIVPEPPPIPTLIPTPTPSPGPEQIGYWVLEDGVATLRWERRGYHDRDAAVLRISCAGDSPVVSIGYDWDGSGTPRKLNPNTRFSATGGTRIGQIVVGGMVYRDGTHTNPKGGTLTWWRLGPEGRWAYHPDPGSFVVELAVGDSLRADAIEAPVANMANGYLPLGGIVTELERLPCVGG